VALRLAQFKDLQSVEGWAIYSDKRRTVSGKAGRNKVASFIQTTLNGSLRGEELEDFPHYALRLIGLEEKLGVRRAI